MTNGNRFCPARSASIFATLIVSVASKRTFGIISTHEDFSYLDRFCFQSATGHLEYSLTYPSSFAAPSLLLYYDTSDQWLRAYKELRKCEDRREVLTNRSLDPAIVSCSLSMFVFKTIRLDPYDRSLNLLGARCRLMTDVFDREWVRCKGTRTFQ
ncbi:hypothetical protein ANCCAN_05551 [Ancylostoma caninum]|uniref:GPR180-like N-terminal domain-containing protein n=1 Tax=Ancylostoma caninum TaxID=29170 RepID=A0A368GVK5_ANCCA|nr:hypothetical protein ANCCAN_05551 [Ancylostoma caninum]